MKKILIWALTVCLLIPMLGMTALAAAEPAEGVVLRVSALKKDDTTVVLQDYTVFEDGWNAAMELAVNRKEMNSNGYVRVVVDLFADWNAVDGQFTADFFNGKGFNWDAICFQPGVKFILNLNGYTVNRGLTDDEMNGEVMYVDKGADVIINGGTITGGWSNNGAGGIHINDGADVTLNDVHIVGNVAEHDDGGGIALYDGATLIMNGGSLTGNIIEGPRGFGSDDAPTGVMGGGIYSEDSTVYLSKVSIVGNMSRDGNTFGAAIYAEDSSVYMEDCTVSGNGVEDTSKNFYPSLSVIRVEDGTLSIKNTTFTGNGSYFYQVFNIGQQNDVENPPHSSALLYLDNTALTMEHCRFDGNASCFLIKGYNRSSVFVTNTDFENNKSSILEKGFYNESYFKNCIFRWNDNPHGRLAMFELDQGHVDFIDCTMPNYRLGNTEFVTVVNTGNADSLLGEGSLVGNGSISMILSLVAVFTACAALGIVVTKLKKKRMIP